MPTEPVPNAPRGPLRLDHLTPVEARQILSSTPRLLVPVGTLVARGGHLPLGTDTLIVERLADDLSALFGVARTPAIPFGVHARHDPETPGSAALTRKTLHRLMNELIAGWENEAKVTDILIITAHGGEAHLEALSTIRSEGRVSLLDIYTAPLNDLTGGAPPDTAILMWLTPSLVDVAAIPPGIPRDPELGARIYDRIAEYAAREIRAFFPT